MTRLPAVSLLLSTAMACASASAATLDFETLLPAGDVGTTVVVLPQASLEGSGTTLYLNEFFPGAGGSVCSAFIPASGSLSCASDLRITFTTAVSQLSLAAIGYDDGDSVTISAFAGGLLLDSQTVTSDTVVDFSGFSGVTQLVFDDQSEGSGYAYGNFSFIQSAGVVPEPSTGLMMGLGIAALGCFAARRRVG